MKKKRESMKNEKIRDSQKNMIILKTHIFKKRETIFYEKPINRKIWEFHIFLKLIFFWKYEISGENEYPPNDQRKFANVKATIMHGLWRHHLLEVKAQ